MPDNSEQVMNRPDLPWDDSVGDHIRILDGVLDHAICDDCIDIFDDLEHRGLCHTRRELGKHYGQMSDTSMYWTEMDAMIHRPMQDIGDWIHNEVIESWQIKYPIIDSGQYQGLYNAQMKMQKTRPGEGYHNWHFEGGSTAYDRNSILAWMVYLNDVEEGGETEWLYQSRRVEPKMGRLVFCPAYFTHTHRGQTPISNDKYIITSMFGFGPPQ